MKTTMADIRKHNKAEGYHWFDKETLEFFGSVVFPCVYDGNGGIYFVSAEVNPSGVRKFTVREYNPETGNVNTVGKFHAHETMGEAVESAKEYAASGYKEESAC